MTLDVTDDVTLDVTLDSVTLDVTVDFDPVGCQKDPGPLALGPAFSILNPWHLGPRS